MSELDAMFAESERDDCWEEVERLQSALQQARARIEELETIDRGRVLQVESIERQHDLVKGDWLSACERAEAAEAEVVRLKEENDRLRQIIEDRKQEAMERD